MPLIEKMLKDETPILKVKVEDGREIAVALAPTTLH